MKLCKDCVYVDHINRKCLHDTSVITIDCYDGIKTYMLCADARRRPDLPLRIPGVPIIEDSRCGHTAKYFKKDK